MKGFYMQNSNTNQKTAQDWVRQLRFSNEVNMQTVGVDTDKVTPQLLLASSNKLLKISRGQQQGDQKDALQFQKVFGPVEYFAQRIQKDGGSVARSMLWKATNKGNLDFIGAGSLQPHISAVFNESNLTRFIDNSTPLQGIDTSMLVTRVGEGGISSQDTAPIEMRLVQPSYFGFIDGVRCYSEDTQIYTKQGWICIKDMTKDTQLATLVEGKPQWNKPLDITNYEYEGPMYGYESQDIEYLVSPGHRMWVARETTKRIQGKRKKVWGDFKKLYVQQIHQKFCKVLSAVDTIKEVDQTQKWFYLPSVEGPSNITKNIQKVDIVDFAAFLGWYISEGCCSKHKNYPETKGYKYQVKISQSPTYNKQNYTQICNLIQKLPFGVKTLPAEQKKNLDIVINRKQLYTYCKQFGNSFQKFIPQWIFQAPTKARWAFVQAMLKGDGTDQRHLNTVSRHLAEDFARLLFQLGQSTNIVKQKQCYISPVTGKRAEDIYVVMWHKTKTLQLWPSNRKHRSKSGRGFYIQHYKGHIYCPTVPGGLVYVKRGNASFGLWSSNTQEKSPGITGYLTKNVMKGTDGKLYQKFYNTRTGKEEYVSSMKAAKSVVTTPEYMDSKDKYIYALGGDKGVRIVKREDVDYILPRADEAWSTCANNVPMLSGIKAMRLLMGCHHPDTPVIVIDKQGYTDIVPAKRTGHLGDIYLFGCDSKGNDKLYPLRGVVPRPTGKNAKFKKVILKSGRTLLTSFEHKWYIYNKQKFELVYADQLKEGMLVPRSVFSSIPVRKTKIMGKNVTEQICILMGRILRTLSIHKGYHKFTYVKNRQGIDQKQDIEKALKQLGVLNYRFFQSKGHYAVSIKDPVFIDWLNNNIGTNPIDFKIPKQILTLPAGYTCAFLDSYYKDLSNVGQDNEGTSWLLEFNNQIIRDGISFMLTKIYTDSKYRDSVYKGVLHRALQLCPLQTTKNDIILQKIVRIQEVEAPALMIDLDCDDNVYAVANGIITHNSKYATQAVPLQQREAPLVRSLDEASGMDMPTILGKKAGSQWAPKAGIIKAVRQDRIDLVYDDGTTGSVNLYKNFPANTKGWISNYVKVKAGQKVNKGQLLATSNYTDENGVLATGRNLRIGYLSYKGGTYEDGCTISQSAAKKMAYTTMYKTAADKDKSIRNSKSLYNTWKPGQYSKQQMQKLDDDGIIKVGAVINKGDPMILGIRTTEPSPGTMGKRLLTDVTEVWDHAHPGIVTDVVNGKSGIKVYATVSSPLKEGDKISALYGNKATCYDSTTYVFTNTGWKLFKDLTDEDQVATLDMDGKAHFQKPSDRQVYDYEGQMIGFDNRYINFLVTPDHKMWCKSDSNYYRKPQKPFQRIPAQEIYNRDFFHRVAAEFPDSGFQPQFFEVPQQYTEAKECNARYNTDHKWKTEDMAAFLGIFLSQGNLQGTYHIKISQKRVLTDPQSGFRCDRIEALLKRMGFNYYCNDAYYIISNKALYIYLQQFGKSADKYVPQEVFTWSRRLQQSFLEWFYIGDGQKVYSNNHKNKGRIRVISKRLIEDLQRLYILNGYEATVKEYKDRTRSYKGVQKVYSRLYGVSFFTDQFRPTVGAASRSGDKVYKGYYKAPYKGKVYCCTVSTGIILVQREGCPMWCGNCSKILPDQEMPKDQKGRPLEVLFDPLGVVSRTNPSQLMQVGLGKVARKIGKPIVVPQFMPKGVSRLKWVKSLMKQHNVPWKQDVYDPSTGRTIKNVFTGQMYFLPLKHISDTKMSARGTASYTADGVPASGGYEGSKRLGQLETAAVVGHNAFDFLVTDAKLIRGQSNADFWRSIRTGQIPVIPGQPLVHKKFFAHLQGSGMNVKKTHEGISIFALSNKDVDQLAGHRELKSKDTYEQKTFQQIPGGLFGKDIFGDDGQHWAYIQLDQPLPNPVMQQPLARLLRLKDKEFEAIVRGKGEFNGLKSAKDIQIALSKVDLQKEKITALKELKEASPSKKDDALKRYVAIAKMEANGVQPAEYMLNKIPVLPPKYRPITSHSGLTMVADSNYLYAQLIDARDDAREAQDLPQQFQKEAQSNIYTKWKQLVGLYDPSDVKLKGKNVKGLLKWALGKSPKYSAFNMKVLGSTVDTVGRGVVIPSTKIKLNQIGMPVQMAWDVYQPFVVRKLVQQNYSPIDAMKMVKEKAPVAQAALKQAVQERPVVMNRAPSLHKLSLMGFNVKLTSGSAIKVNPSIVVPFNMDFDGDTVNLHVPVSKRAIEDIRQNMMPQRNLISMRNKKILYKPQKGYIQGLYVATRMGDSTKGVATFNTLAQARDAFRSGKIDIDSPIIIKQKQ